jgi:radical SAM superfamily enzyme YgiQ (UPF0313 family)
MKKKLLIIVLFQNLAGENRYYYAKSPAPPLSGALLAGLTPPVVDVELLHEMIRPIDYNTDADIIALSFMDYCFEHAKQVSHTFRNLGKTVIAGGRYATNFPDEVIPYFDSTVIGEAEGIWEKVVNDAVDGRLEKFYKAPVLLNLNCIPAPRYDLIESGFAMPVVTEATRGCQFSCSYCQLTINNLPYRKRPIEDVINDLKSAKVLPFHKRKFAMILDNNLGGDRKYAKALLKEVAKLKLWGLGVQFSFDCLQDDEFVDLLEKAHCRMAFIGMESINEPSLASVHKKQNRVEEYKELFYKLKKRGILIFAGLMVAMDEDTKEYYNSLPEKLEEVDPAAILTSMSIPIPGTQFHKTVENEGRIVDRKLSHYEGDHLVLKPKKVTPQEVFDAYKNINEEFYSYQNIFRRWIRLVKAQLGFTDFVKRFISIAVSSVILFKLSIFQKDHARKKVYPLYDVYSEKPVKAPKYKRFRMILNSFSILQTFDN